MEIHSAVILDIVEDAAQNIRHQSKDHAYALVVIRGMVVLNQENAKRK